jgi:hypothetical protein
MADAYVVAATTVVVKIAGGERYLGRGVPVPAAVDADHLRHLVEVGLVKKVAVPVAEDAPKDEPKPVTPAPKK